MIPDAAVLQFLQRVPQGCMLGAAELGLAGVAENLRYGAAFASCDTVVQVFKAPIQLLAQNPAHTTFPGSHKADQNNRVSREYSAWSRSTASVAHARVAWRARFGEHPFSKLVVFKC